MFPLGLNSALIKLGLVVALVLGGYFWHNHQVSSFKEQVYSEIKAELDANTIEVLRTARVANDNLNDQLTKQRKNTNEKIARINATHNSIVAGLQQRTSRTDQPRSDTSDTGDTKTPQVSDGSRLYREDSIFLAGEATRADTLRVELQSCYNAHDALRQTLNELRNKK